MKQKLFLLVLALQCAWILGTTAMQEHALATGQVILLETARVDPRDLLRGDYLILNYAISDVPTNLFSPRLGQDVPPGTKVFVALEPGTNQFYHVMKASTNALAPENGQVVLKGATGWFWGGPQAGRVHVEYGLERYYVREGTGNPAGKLTVRAVATASGQARIKEVLLDGKPYAGAMKAAER